ncbi:PREDICTED: protein FAM47E isoform X2 [Bison bison bison]|uniref:Protein FAM47E isoform X2 n=1 Tax=Bison bison bison TaxID=43346 RepID=A0A6P3HBE4_BISBB|nr:PREDICTED: protein FAM47E isoform X2 [Bison bison bison]
MADHSRLFPPAPRAGMRVGRTCRPRYRENLPSKCFMEHKGGLPGPTSLDSRRWRFVRTGPDDFRRGCPPCEGLATLGPREGLLPQIYHRAPPPAPKKRHTALCSKLSPAQQARKAFLAAIEAQLTLHPLALYPDLEEDMPTEVTSCPGVVGGPSMGPGECCSLDAWGVPSRSEDDDCLPGESSSGVWSSLSGNADDSTIPPRSQPTYKGSATQKCLTSLPLKLYQSILLLLLKVLEVLDPDKKLEDTWAYCQGIRKRMKKPTKLLKKRSTQVYLGLPKKSPVSHPCQWLYEKRKPSETGLLQKDGLLLHENIRQGVSDFCNWATAFGSLNIDEEFILRQFDINYQSKPCYNVLHTIRPSKVPLELKKRSGLNKLQEPQLFQKLDCEQRLRKPQKPHKPKWVKMRYGAWYLNPKLWKKQRADEPLVDPKVLRKAQDENFKKELQEQEELLVDLHGAVAFKNFILSRGYRMPSFLEKMYMKKECKRECNQR